MTTQENQNVIAAPHIDTADQLRDPKNRPESNGGLSSLDMDITSDIGKDRYEPTSLVIAANNGHLSKLEPVTGLKSDISGEPAVLYRTHEIRLQLTPAELSRMALRKLEPHEVKALLMRYGEFYEVLADFYDPVTYDALAML